MNLEAVSKALVRSALATEGGDPDAAAEASVHLIELVDEAQEGWLLAQRNCVAKHSRASCRAGIFAPSRAVSRLGCADAALLIAIDENRMGCGRPHSPPPTFAPDPRRRPGTIAAGPALPDGCLHPQSRFL